MEMARKLEEMLVELDDAIEYAEATDTAFTREYAMTVRMRRLLKKVLATAVRFEGGVKRRV
jgi:hypothetical protein